MKQKAMMKIRQSKDLLLTIPFGITTPDTTPKKLCFGGRTIDVAITSHPSTEIIISSALAKELGIPLYPYEIHVFGIGNTVYIGPLIGIFTTELNFLHKRDEKRNRSYFARILLAARKSGCIGYLFDSSCIDWEKKIVKGYSFDGKNFFPSTFPFPNVVYDRVQSRRDEEKQSLLEVKKRFQDELTIPWYNPGFFNKLDVHHCLMDLEEAASFLPETYPLQSYSQIEYLLSKFGKAIIKPINGSMGSNIFFLMYDRKSNHYYCRYRNSKGENKLQRFTTIEALVDNVIGLGAFQDKIVQQGIGLLTFEGRKLDFRVHTNKNQNGEWLVSIIAVKVAGNGSVTTHVHTGGEVKTLEESFQLSEQEKIVSSLTDAALALSRGLERSMQGVIAEIGFDLGMDKKGHVWMFEANSKPGEIIFHHPKLAQQLNVPAEYCFDYGIFLSEKIFIRNGEGLS
ncbi:YheC/YheD family protein [Peribacillus alkalitolerans]|uniref:YheC/YheD family endospore coat-associated protein n=1 Tax=Peribacillus alkalitolerans TaxID=1550385 RepID=UPI0013D4D620|nr:YheC/YheD family protein [Peribacillus alkalitolerans]